MKKTLILISLVLSACSSTPKKSDSGIERAPAVDAASILYPYEATNKLNPPSSKLPNGFEGEELLGSHELKIMSWIKRGAQSESPTVIYIHGNGECLSGISTSGYLNWLTSRDINFFTYDFPKYGYSSGKLSEQSMTEAALLVFKSAVKRFPNSNIIIIGRSLGAGVAMKLIGLPEVQSRTKGLILISPWTSVPELGKFTHPVLSLFLSTKGNEYNSLAAASNITTPTLILHGTDDKTIPSALGEKLASSFSNRNVELHLLPGLDHNQMLGDPELQERVIGFINQ